MGPRHPTRHPTRRPARRPARNLARLLLALLLFCAVAKNVVNYRVHDYAAWLVRDWGLRVAAIYACLWLLHLDADAKREAGLRPGPLANMAVAFLAFGLLDIIMTERLLPVLMDLLPGRMRIPLPDNPALLAMDIYLGLALVAVSEELAFRGVLVGLCRKHGLGWIPTFCITSLAFGLLHTSHGLLVMANAAMFGVLALGARRMGKSLLPPMALHYVHNVIVWQNAFY